MIVRPERMAWRMAPDDSLDNAAEGVVCKTAFLGMYTQIIVELADGATAIIHQTGEEKQTTCRRTWSASASLSDGRSEMVSYWPTSSFRCKTYSRIGCEEGVIQKEEVIASRSSQLELNNERRNL